MTRDAAAAMAPRHAVHAPASWRPGGLHDGHDLSIAPLPPPAGGPDVPAAHVPLPLPAPGPEAPAAHIPLPLPAPGPDAPAAHIPLPLPAPGPEAAEAWVAEHLGDLALEGPAGVAASPGFRGGQRAADAALAAFDVRGYAADRNEVWPASRRGASALSPYVRYGLLALTRLWEHVADGPPRDRDKFRDELLWQEYARHLYARLGTRLRAPLRATQPLGDDWQAEAWPREMACVGSSVDQLERDGWLVNQQRMWLASQYSMRAGRDWREGEDAFFRHLLDGSRAANRLGWQWVVGMGTGKAYGFSRWQVEKRAPGLCATCALRHACPIEAWPRETGQERVTPPAALRADRDLGATTGPREVTRIGDGGIGSAEAAPAGGPEVVWLTAESLGDADPALAAHPELPAVFVFDAPLLAHLRLSGKKLVFFAETLADLASRRPVELHRGDPVDALAGRALAVTHAPVPGFRRRAAALRPVEVYPWPWLVAPHAGPAQSFTAWRRGTGLGASVPRPRRARRRR